MSIDVATSIARILKAEAVEWVSTFPVCRVNNALGREGVPMMLASRHRSTHHLLLSSGGSSSARGMPFSSATLASQSS